MIEHLRKRCIQRSRGPVTAALRRAAVRGDLPSDVDTELVQDVWAGTAGRAVAVVVAGKRRMAGKVAFGRIYPLVDGVPVLALAAVPPTTMVAGHPVTFSASVWRDFMPSTERDSSALIVVVTATAVATGVLPPFLRADRIAVLHREEAWVAPLVDEHPRSRTSRMFEMAARQGPKWEPGTSVDVVVQLQGEAADLKLVRLTGQLIRAAS